jgi:hypothetical protein
MSGFFDGLARDFRGWEGERVWTRGRQRPRPSHDELDLFGTRLDQTHPPKDTDVNTLTTSRFRGPGPLLLLSDVQWPSSNQLFPAPTDKYSFVLAYAATPHADTAPAPASPPPMSHAAALTVARARRPRPTCSRPSARPGPRGCVRFWSLGHAPADAGAVPACGVAA